MPVIDKDGNIGYYEWESKLDYEWLGISRIPSDPKTIVKDLDNLDRIIEEAKRDD